MVSVMMIAAVVGRGPPAFGQVLELGQNLAAVAWGAVVYQASRTARTRQSTTRASSERLSGGRDNDSIDLENPL